MEITNVYQKLRKDYGRAAVHLAATEPTVHDYDDWPTPPGHDDTMAHPQPSLDPGYVDTFLAERNPSILDLQAMPDKTLHEVNTVNVEYLPIGMLHLEGGWPLEVDSSEKEQTQRYRKKVEKDDDYIRQVKALVDNIEDTIKQNTSIDIYQEYFAGEGAADYSAPPPSAKTLAVFKDPTTPSKRSACSVSWHPDAGRKLAVAFAIMQFQDKRMDDQVKENQYSYIWDVNNPNTPEQELKPPSPLCCLEYNPKDPHLLAGGSYNGLVTCYDTRIGSDPKETSIIESSHRDPVYKLAWLAGKTPFECVSTSTDGQVLWWDVRKLGEPIESLWVEEKTEEKTKIGGTSLEYSGAGGKFMVGSEQGKIAACSRKGKTPADKVGNIWEAHSGPVYALQRNAYYPKFYLTVGDWSVKVWNEEIRTPIISSKFFKSYVLDAAWSPVRPGVFVTAKMDGCLDVWDIFYKQHDPTLSLQVHHDGLKCVRMQEQGVFVATGSVDGQVYMLELSEGLATMQANEKSSVMNMLERESKREKNLEARAKELKAKAKRAEDAANNAQTQNENPWEDQVKNIEDKFWQTVGQDHAGAPA